eukprot:364362-Chlamydomonas_euryale.AAC.2
MDARSCVPSRRAVLCMARFHARLVWGAYMHPMHSSMHVGAHWPAGRPDQAGHHRMSHRFTRVG